MVIFLTLRTAAAQAFAKCDFEAPFRVTIPFAPGWPPDQHMIDCATTFTLDPARKGRFRRTIDADAGEVTWRFENGADAAAFAVRFS